MHITLRPGAYYTNGRHDIRQIVSISDDPHIPHQITYKICAAKQNTVWGGTGELIEVGGLSECLYSSFAIWAKQEISEGEAYRRSAGSLLRRRPLAEIEQRFLQQTAQRQPSHRRSTALELLPDEGEQRIVRALISKGVLLAGQRQGSFRFTPLGLAVLDIVGNINPFASQKD